MATTTDSRRDARRPFPPLKPTPRRRVTEPAVVLAFAAMGVLFGRAALLGDLAPFGPALVAAADWTWGLGPAAATLAGAVAGAAGARGGLAGAEALLLSAAAVVYARTRGAAPAGSGWWGTTVAGVAVLIGTPFALARAPAHAWASTIAQAALVPLLAALLAPALDALRRRTAGSAGDDAAGSDSVAVALGLAAGSAIAVAGMGGLHAGPVELRGSLASLLVLAAAYVSGAGGGAAAGTVLGLASFLFGSGGPGVVAGWGFGGLLAGAFAPWGRLPAALGFVVGAGLALLPSPLGELPDVMAGAGMLLGSVVFLLSPIRLWPAARLAGLGWPRPLAHPSGRPAGGSAAAAPAAGQHGAPRRANMRVLRGGVDGGRERKVAPATGVGLRETALRVAQAAREVAASAGGGRVGGARQPAIAGPAGASDAPDHLARFAGAFRKLAEVFEPVARPGGPSASSGAGAPGAKTGADARADAEDRALSRALRSEVCRGCPAHHACWKLHEQRTEAAVRELIAQARRDGRLSRQRLRGFWATGCHRPGEVVVMVNLSVETLRRERRRMEEGADGRGLVAAQLRGVADMVERLAATAGRGDSPPRPWETREPLLEYQVGAAKRARPGRLVSGDTHLVKEIGHRLLVALSDGMGVGGTAARQSQAAVSLLESLLDAGVDCESAVHAVNTALLLRNRDESFATLDVLLIDRRDGTARFLKIGGAPGYLVRDGDILPIRGGGVPLGIIRDVRVTTRRCRLAPGDVAVLISDGVWEARPGAPDEDWVRGFLAMAAGQDPGALAAGLVAAAAGDPGAASGDPGAAGGQGATYPGHPAGASGVTSPLSSLPAADRSGGRRAPDTLAPERDGSDRRGARARRRPAPRAAAEERPHDDLTAVVVRLLPAGRPDGPGR